MKNRLLLLLSLIALSGFSQNAPINFETSGNGATWNWITFENGANAPLQIVANPSASGINTSSTVAKLTTSIICAVRTVCIWYLYYYSKQLYSENYGL